MKYVWGGDRALKNTELWFSLKINSPCDILRVSAVDFFQVFTDGTLRAFGPERAPAGFSRIKTVDIKNVSEILIKVVGYNVPSYACDFQLPFFGAEILSRGKVQYSTFDFSCQKAVCRITDMPRYSGQRGFVEGYDYTDVTSQNIEIYEVPAPTILNNIPEQARYDTLACEILGQGEFTGFSTAREIKPKNSESFIVETELLEKTKTGFCFFDFYLQKEKTGFLQLEIQVDEPTLLYAVFDEYLPDGKWCFRRSGCNDFLLINCPKGKQKFLSFEPYSFKYLKILTKGKASVKPSLILYENANVSSVKMVGDAKICAIFEAARNTFGQNAVDIFTDCPGRERAGWLCDSYFTAMSERLFTGGNKMEKLFLENFLLADTPEIEKNMLPMCFPAEHPSGRFIPNWSLWFVLEIAEYYKRANDELFIVRAKEKVYAILHYFDSFLNEFGLIENLRAENRWVFIEWSIANSLEYVQGVNFPTNMLYACALEKAGELYDDDDLKKQAQTLKKTIENISFNGEFFIDNAVRLNGKLVCQQEHISETCQYYALFTGLCPTRLFAEKMCLEFGPTRTTAYPEVGKSNMFIGNYLRLFWLCDIGEYDQALQECVGYFYDMSQKTGTLWEKDLPIASCNHGFASVVAVVLAKCLVGYQTVENGKVILCKERAKKDYQTNLIFQYAECS